MMDAAAECQVVAFPSLEIEPIRIFEYIRIPVGRAEQDDDILALTHGETVHFAVLERAPHTHLDR